MLTRYLGNKTQLLGPILEEIGAVCTPGAVVGDLFAGTMSVALALKRHGYRVVANDHNAFSASIGRAFVAAGEIPEVRLAEVVADPRPLRDEARRQIGALHGPGFAFLADRSHRERYADLAALVLHLGRAPADALPATERRTHFFDTYTEAGARSAFRSARGRAGRRRFFSGENGLRIDAIVNHLRCWLRSGTIAPVLYDLLCCVLLRAVDRVANTQGTYHDFPRAFTDTRALQPLRLELPPMDDVLCGGTHVVGDAEDSLEFARRTPPMQALYLDPPYNFRQYGDYYFLPNLLCRYGRLDDPDTAFADVRHVRGQPAGDRFASPFCRRDAFVDSLGALVDRARAATVILSYFDGRNHWSAFEAGPDRTGLAVLGDFFAGPRFLPGSLTVRPIPRRNYQSYGGHRARPVLEYLFVARTAGTSAAAAG